MDRPDTDNETGIITGLSCCDANNKVLMPIQPVGIGIWTVTVSK